MHKLNFSRTALSNSKPNCAFHFAFFNYFSMLLLSNSCLLLLLLLVGMLSFSFSLFLFIQFSVYIYICKWAAVRRKRIRKCVIYINCQPRWWQLWQQQRKVVVVRGIPGKCKWSTSWLLRLFYATAYFNGDVQTTFVVFGI